MSIFQSIRIKRMNNEEYIEYLRTKGLQIGSDCEVYKTAAFGSEPYLIKIGNHVRVNHQVTFVTHDGGVWILREMLSNPNLDLFRGITIGNNVHIGTNATIMPGVKIGNNCIIGCGAIVTHNIPDNSIAVGVPARIIEIIDEYVEKHKDDFDCVVRQNNMNEQEKRNYLIGKYMK